MRIIIAKFSPWSYKDYKESEHPEYSAIRNIISQHPQHRFVLVGEGHENGYFERDGVQFFNLNSKKGIHYIFSFLLKLELAALFRPSVIVVLGTINLIPFGLSSIITKSKLIPTVTGEIGYSVQSMWKPLRMIFSNLLKVSLRHSSTILCLSKSIRRELVSNCGIDPMKIVLYKYRVSEAFNPYVSKSLKPTLNPTGPVVLTLSRVSQEKGIEYLVEAAKQIVEEASNVRVIIKGSSQDRRYKERLTRLVRKYDLDNNISFLEFSPNSEVPKFLSASDILVVPSISEGLPLVIMEAMATGVPIVASRVGGIPDIVTDGYNGLLVAPGNPQDLAEAVLKLLSDNELRQRLKERGLETVRLIEENDIEKLLNRLIFQAS